MAASTCPCSDAKDAGDVEVEKDGMAEEMGAHVGYRMTGMPHAQ